MALGTAVLASTVVLSYWALWRFVRGSNRIIADNWRTMDRRRRLAVIGLVVGSWTLIGLFVTLVSVGENGLAVALAAIIMAVVLAGSVAAGIAESRKARRRARKARAADERTDAT